MTRNMGLRRQRWLVLIALVSLLLRSSFSDAARVPSLIVLQPQNHSSHAVDDDALTVRGFVLALRVVGVDDASDCALELRSEKLGTIRHATALERIVVDGIEPGTHFWTLQLVRVNGSHVADPVVLHLEFVVPQQQQQQQQQTSHAAATTTWWRYELTRDDRAPRRLFNWPLPTSPVRHARPRPRPRLPLCFVSSTNGLFDGQKKMWLQVLTALRSRHVQEEEEEEEEDEWRWELHVKAFEQLQTDAPLTRALQALNVSMSGLEIRVQREDLQLAGVSDDALLPALLSSLDNATKASPSAAAAALAALPPFARRVWTSLVQELRATCHRGVLVFANSRSLTDELLVRAARLAGVAAVVMELANLAPRTSEPVDVLLAPSHFALHHPSVTRVAARERHVLTTGIDTTVFRPPTSSAALPSLPFTVGYIGRLATEKSLGLVLAAFRELQRRCLDRCRLRLVGDGPLRRPLEALVADWRLRGVEFLGGVYVEHELAAVARELHVAVSPAFVETLGIAALEAMSSGIPVVGFACGGVGDFLEHGVNGLAVPQPTAHAMADALLSLYRNESLRQSLGRQARATVLRRFEARVGVEQYLTLYQRLGRRFLLRFDGRENVGDDMVNEKR